MEECKRASKSKLQTQPAFLKENNQMSYYQYFAQPSNSQNLNGGDISPQKINFSGSQLNLFSNSIVKQQQQFDISISGIPLVIGNQSSNKDKELRNLFLTSHNSKDQDLLNFNNFGDSTAQSPLSKTILPITDTSQIFKGEIPKTSTRSSLNNLIIYCKTNESSQYSGSSNNNKNILYSSITNTQLSGKMKQMYHSQQFSQKQEKLYSILKSENKHERENSSNTYSNINDNNNNNTLPSSPTKASSPLKENNFNFFQSDCASPVSKNNLGFGLSISSTFKKSQRKMMISHTSSQLNNSEQKLDTVNGSQNNYIKTLPSQSAFQEQMSPKLAETQSKNLSIKIKKRNVTQKKSEEDEKMQQRKKWHEEQWAPESAWLRNQASRKSFAGTAHFFDQFSDTPLSPNKFSAKIIDKDEKKRGENLLQNLLSPMTFNSQIPAIVKKKVMAQNETMRDLNILSKSPSQKGFQSFQAENIKTTLNFHKNVLHCNRKSINHQFFKDIRNQQIAKAKKEYLDEEIVKAQHFWDSQSLIKAKETQIQQNHSSISFEQKMFQKKLRENQITNQQADLLKSIAANSRRFPLNKEGKQVNQKVNSIRDENVPNKVHQSNLISQKFQQQDNQSPYHKAWKNIFNDLECEEEQDQKLLVWQEKEGVLEELAKKAFFLLQQTEFSEEITNVGLEMLVDLLRAVSSSIQNCNSYLIASMKLKGWNPIISEQFCLTVSEILKEDLSIPEYKINRFKKMYSYLEKNKWEFMDYIGGKDKIVSICNYFMQLVSKDVQLSSAFRLLNLNEERIIESAWLMIMQEKLKFKQYFNQIKLFIQPIKVMKISNIKFFKATQNYLKTALNKFKIDDVRQNRILYLIEQIRNMVTILRNKDNLFEDLILPQQPSLQVPYQENKEINKTNILENTIKSVNYQNQNNNNESNHSNNQGNSAQKSSEQEQNKSQENPSVQSSSISILLQDQTPQICNQIAKDILEELIKSLRIRQAALRLPSHLKNKTILIKQIGELAQVFCCNTHCSTSYSEVLNHDKLGIIVRMCYEFFFSFSKELLAQVKQLKVSIYLQKDIKKRLDHLKIKLNKEYYQKGNSQRVSLTSSTLIKLEAPSNTINQGSLASSTSIMPIPIKKESEYLNGHIFLSELLDLSAVFIYLEESSHNSIYLTKLSPFNKSFNLQAHFKLLFQYCYQCVDSQSLPETLSAFDFQCYVTLKKLSSEYFSELKKIFFQICQEQLSLSSDLSERLISEYEFALHGIKMYGDVESPHKVKFNKNNQKASTLQSFPGIKSTGKFQDLEEDEQAEF